MKQSGYLAMTIALLVLILSLPTSSSTSIMNSTNNNKKCIEKIFGEIKSILKHKHNKQVSLPGKVEFDPLQSKMEKTIKMIENNSEDNYEKHKIADGIKSISEFLLQFPYFLPDKLEKKIKERRDISHSHYNKHRTIKAARFIKQFYELLFTNKKSLKLSKLSSEHKEKLKRKLKLSNKQAELLDQHFFMEKNFRYDPKKYSHIKIPHVFSNRRHGDIKIPPAFSSSRYGDVNGLKICKNCKSKGEIWKMLKHKIGKHVTKLADKLFNKNYKEKMNKVIKKAVNKFGENSQKSLDKQMFGFVKSKLHNPDKLRKIKKDLKKHSHKPKKQNNVDMCRNPKAIAQLIIEYFMNKF